ncbi:MAG: hypothetical protein IIA33_02785, partial [Planctomycetes bacterium]|nr:hypothetical protein [Planctomycetota bacterium]
LLTTVDTVVGCGPGYSDIEYNPEISRNVYIMYSAFSGGTLNLLFVLDPTDGFNLLATFDYSTSIETTREIAFDACGNLFVGQYGGSATPDGPPTDIIFDAVNLDSLADNNSVDWYTSLTQSSFSGIDVAIGGADCVVDPCGACPWDASGDGDVGAFDLAQLLGNWGTLPKNAAPEIVCLDADDDNDIDAFDLANLLGNWGPC